MLSLWASSPRLHICDKEKHENFVSEVSSSNLIFPTVSRQTNGTERSVASLQLMFTDRVGHATQFEPNTKLCSLCGRHQCETKPIYGFECDKGAARRGFNDVIWPQCCSKSLKTSLLPFWVPAVCRGNLFVRAF